MDQNLSVSPKTGEKKPNTGYSNIFGSSFKKDNLEKRSQELKSEASEINELKQYEIDKGIAKIKEEGVLGRVKPMIPSLIALFLSYFIDVSKVPFLGKVAENMANWVFPGQVTINKALDPISLWWLPFLVYILYILMAEMSYRKLMEEVSTKGISQEIIDKITNRYASIVDGVGTALPLLGAAILLISIKEGPIVFLGFSVPFEIKAIVVLAIAKLFEIVFDSQALKFAEIREDVSTIEKAYFQERDDMHQRMVIQTLHDAISKRADVTPAGEKFSKEDAAEIYNTFRKAAELSDQMARHITTMRASIAELSKVNLHDAEVLKELQVTAGALNTALSASNQISHNSDAMFKNVEALKNMIIEINSIKMPSEQMMKELQITSHMLTETVNSLKDAQAIKGLDNLAFLAGKRQ